MLCVLECSQCVSDPSGDCAKHPPPATPCNSLEQKRGPVNCMVAKKKNASGLSFYIITKLSERPRQCSVFIHDIYTISHSYSKCAPLGKCFRDKHSIQSTTERYFCQIIVMLCVWTLTITHTTVCMIIYKIWIVTMLNEWLLSYIISIW